MKNQKGFGALEALLIVVIVAIVGFVGWYVIKNKEDKKPTTTTVGSQTVKTGNAASNQNAAPTTSDLAAEYTLIKTAITEQSTFCTNKSADFGASPTVLEAAAATDAFNANTNAVMTNDATFSRVAFGCKGGTQGEVAVLQKVSGKWMLVAEDASTIMPCSKVDGKKIPSVILKECYPNSQNAAPRALQN